MDVLNAVALVFGWVCIGSFVLLVVIVAPELIRGGDRNRDGEQ